MNVGDKVTVNTKLVSGNGTIKSLFSKRRDYAMVVLESNEVCCVALEYLIPSPNGEKTPDESEAEYAPHSVPEWDPEWGPEPEL